MADNCFISKFSVQFTRELIATILPLYINALFWSYFFGSVNPIKLSTFSGHVDVLYVVKLNSALNSPPLQPSESISTASSLIDKWDYFSMQNWKLKWKEMCVSSETVWSSTDCLSPYTSITTAGSTSLLECSFINLSLCRQWNVKKLTCVQYLVLMELEGRICWNAIEMHVASLPQFPEIIQFI